MDMVEFLYFTLAMLMLVVALLLPLLTLLLFLWAEQKRMESYWKYQVGVHRDRQVDLAEGKRGLKRLFWKILDWWY